MTHNQKGMTKVLILLLVLLAFATLGVGFYIFKTTTETRKTITVDDLTVSYDLGTKSNVRQGQNDNRNVEFYEAKIPGSDRVIVSTVYKPQITKVESDMNCGKYASSKTKILGEEHTLCNQNDTIYVANFKANNTWYQTLVVAKDKGKVDPSIAKTLLGSIQQVQ